MAERRTRRRRRAWDVPLAWLIAAGALAIALATVGWWIAIGETMDTGRRLEEAVFRALTVNTLSELYARPLGGPEGVSDNRAAALLILARWIGVGVFFATLFKVVISLFLERWLAWYCKTFWRDHIVIIGARPFAEEVAEAAADKRLRVVHFCPGGRETTRNGILTLDSSIGLDALIEQAAAHRARSLIFAQSDNAEAADWARRVFDSDEFARKARRESRERLPGAAARRGPHIFVWLDDGWFEHREELAYAFHKPAAGGDVHEDGALDSVVELISESRLAARAVLAAHPVYTLGHQRTQHILLIGFGAMGEALLSEICETQRTDPDRLQKITILDPDADSWTRFSRRCPEWEEVFDGQFYGVTIDEPGEAAPVLLARLDEAPVTAAYVATGDKLDPAIGAARLKQAFGEFVEAGLLDEADAAFPIFTCVRGAVASRSAASARLDHSGEGRLSTMPILPFGAWEHIVTASRVLEAEPDRAAFDVHTVHSALYGRKPPIRPAEILDTARPATNWSDVREVSRYSSRSAAAFVPALIHAAGFDLSDWLAAFAPGPPSINDLPALPEGRSLAEDDSEIVYLARLEHIRWCAERRLQGFRHGPVKQAERKRHPDLVAFADLPKQSQIYNINYIETLSEALARRYGAMRGAVPVAGDRVGARRILVRPSDYKLLEAAGRVPPRHLGLQVERADGKL